MRRILIRAALASCAFSMGAHGEAEPWFAVRLELLRGRVEAHERTPERDPAGFVQSRVELGDALLVTRDHEEAIRQYELALGLQQRQFQGLQGQDIVPRLIERIGILTRMGNVLLDANRNGQALRTLNHAIALANWGVDDRHEAIRDLRTAHALALVHTLPIGEADALFRQLHRSAVVAYPEEHPVLARILDRWAVVSVSTGKHAEAIGHIRQSVQIKEKAFGDRHPQVTESLAMLASLEYAHGDRALVDPLLQRVLAIRTAAFGDAHPLTRTARENMAAK